MSIRAMIWAWEQELKSGPKLVLLKLADNSNDEGICWPSMATIQRHTGLSRSSVIRYTKQLEQGGFLKVQRRRADGINLSNVYELHLGVVSHRHQGVVSHRHQGSVTQTPEPSLNQKQKVSNRARVVKRPDTIKPEVWDDWKQTRKAPLTPTAWKAIRKQLDLGNAEGFTDNEMIAECCQAGWRGFKLEWFLNRTGKQAVERKQRRSSDLWDSFKAALSRGPDARKAWLEKNPQCREAIRSLGGAQYLAGVTMRELDFKRKDFLASIQNGETT